LEVERRVLEKGTDPLDRKGQREGYSKKKRNTPNFAEEKEENLPPKKGGGKRECFPPQKRKKRKLERERGGGDLRPSDRVVTSTYLLKKGKNQKKKWGDDESVPLHEGKKEAVLYLLGEGECLSEKGGGKGKSLLLWDENKKKNRVRIEERGRKGEWQAQGWGGWRLGNKETYKKGSSFAFLEGEKKFGRAG